MQNSKNVKNSKKHQNRSEAAIKLFIGGLPKDSTEAELYEILRQHATIINIELKRRKNKRSQKCLGHGILTTDLQGSHSLLQLRKFVYRGRIVAISPYLTGDDLETYKRTFSQRRLFVKGVPLRYSERNLRDVFKGYGALETCYFRQEPESPDRLGVVIFKEASSATRAFNDMFLLSRQRRTTMNVAFSFEGFKNNPNPNSGEFGEYSSAHGEYQNLPFRTREGWRTHLGSHRGERIFNQGDDYRPKTTQGRSIMDDLDPRQFTLPHPQAYNESWKNLDSILEEEDFYQSNEGYFSHEFDEYFEEDPSLVERFDRLPTPPLDSSFSAERERYEEKLTEQINTRVEIRHNSNNKRKKKNRKKNIPWSSRGRSIFYHREDRSVDNSRGDVSTRKEPLRVRVSLTKKIELEFHNIKPVDGRYASAPSRSVRLLQNHYKQNLQLNYSPNDFESKISSNVISKDSFREERVGDLEFDPNLLQNSIFIRKSLPSRGRSSGLI